MQLAILGAGKIAGAIVHGLLEKRLFQPGQITGTARSEKSRDAFTSIHPGLKWADSAPSAIEGASIILLAVKPPDIPSMIALASARNPDALFISVAAGVRLASMEKAAALPIRALRCMPNTPVLLGKGVTAITANGHCLGEDIAEAEAIFGSVGLVVRVEESMMDAVTALSGSGPAYFYHIIGVLAAVAEQEGLPPGLALRMAAQTASGAAEMLLQTGRSPEELIAQVKSKGGTTEAGLGSLAIPALENILRATIQSASTRSRELSQST